MSSLVPRPSAASFLVAYVTFEHLSDKLAEAYLPAYLTRVQRSCRNEASK